MFSVRTAAATNLRRLTELLGSEWAVSTIIPQLTAMSNRLDSETTTSDNMIHNDNGDTLVHPSAHRMASLLALASICPALESTQLVEEHVISIALKLCLDPVPNVRFNAAKTLELAIPYVDKRLVSTNITPSLTNMLQDSDRDVQYYAGRAITAATA